MAAPAETLEGEETAEEAQAEHDAREAFKKEAGCVADHMLTCEGEEYKPVCASTRSMDRETEEHTWMRKTFSNECSARSHGFSGKCKRYLTEGSCEEGAAYPDLDAEPSDEEAAAAAAEENPDDFKPAETDADPDGYDADAAAEGEAAAEQATAYEPPPTDPEAERLRGEYDAKRSEIDKLNDKERELKDTLDQDFGPSKVYEPLQHECFSITHGEWIYEICPYKDAKQKGKHGGGSTDLGRWDKWTNDYTTMEFKNGQACWNGPIRSMIVTVKCGGVNKVTKVDEPETCTYVAEFETPAACTEEDKNLALAEVESCAAPDADA